MSFWKLFSKPHRPSASTDVEQGLQPPGPQLPRPSIVSQAPIANFNAPDKLTEFRLLVGITSNSSMVPNTFKFFGGRAAANVGIYARVIHNEQNAKRGYKIFSTMINSFLVLQIIVAAALTAMGAANSSHGAITTFGAINTVIAGALTFLKGSGLPHRLKYYYNEWRRVREYIEQREREFSRPGHDHNLFEVINTIERMYEEVKTDVQSNTPDAYVSIGHLNRQRDNALDDRYKSGVSAISSSFNEKSDMLKEGMNEKVEEVSANANKNMEKVEGAAHGKARFLEVLPEKIEHAVQDHGDTLAGLKTKAEGLSGLVNKAQHLAADISHHAQEGASDASKRGEDIGREIRDADKGIDVHIEAHK